MRCEDLGGIPFFVSLFFLLVLSVANILILPHTFYEDSLIRWTLFLTGCAAGAIFGYKVIRGHVAVFLHELKHAIVSNLAGNRAKGMLVRNDHGHFEYMYSSQTAHMNPIIALAPYFVPAVTVPLLLIALLFSTVPAVPLVLVGIGYSIDMALAYKDLGPWQTDLSTIRGGYAVGLLYVIAMNVVILSFLAAWVSGGLEGLVLVPAELFTVLEHLVGVTPPQ